ncbi:DNA-J related domain-containing protein [Gilvimarinus sp. SDUM040013]|uniref:DNA-J related domain-containing protein n=1 Tax=Gilvimarinus gilvus TaxID=3058038 RepID=A0ABU4RXW7_9GAMM|nr:DNA-J related domain-containing protein [Gilvimarinus sp. SDUM040013]MDO3386470.1 DNA-J related domain-containing protein [Gilvimarinus sp. SDUM040013]MDX6849736.1 DNA-J related domain-containing protein [Gilvimarinus sp. SDUM040013]
MANSETLKGADRPNPLLEMVRQLLFEDGQQFSEHALLKIAVARGLIPEEFGSCSKRLFQAHFVLFNALYHLQQELAAQALYLDIGLVQVSVRRFQPASGARELGSSRDEKLRRYYFDWSHFDQATVASVNEMLDDFWLRMGRQPVVEADRTRALDVMGLADPVSWSAVKQRYRRLAMQHHPDRGGDVDQLKQVNWAMTILEKSIQC